MQAGQCIRNESSCCVILLRSPVDELGLGVLITYHCCRGGFPDSWITLAGSHFILYD